MNTITLKPNLLHTIVPSVDLKYIPEVSGSELSSILYQNPIINSFIMVKKYGYGEIYDSRLSNGPMEALNRKVKDLKRLGRGYKNFELFRNRLLYSSRSNPVLNGSPESSQVQYFDNDYF